ncbi:MAG TPA: CoA pyrophosphatase [Mesotoga sp.]|nr:CoA pyrophosphatase [Mesotoga sp.]MDI9376314.1 CoA pyrophosphatase [Thermotogota bacterium]MDD4041655.1 CoA pyrophosphatase [Mesotoga sp.]MDD5745320.1 CoA pyrophosphatase [Mesotoga sp.]HPB64572.1 CoA pyrophosphatase [Mesotoga sp.]
MESTTAVLVPVLRICGDDHLILTRRSRKISHPGQMSFPGGHRENGETLLECAVREMEEEIGASPSRIEEVCPLGVTTTVTSGKVIVPFIGFIDRPFFRLNRSEVEDLVFLSIPALKYVSPEPIVMPSGKVTIRYRFPGFIVWGATARIIESSLNRIVELIDRRNRGMPLCNDGLIDNKKE